MYLTRIRQKRGMACAMSLFLAHTLPQVLAESKVSSATLGKVEQEHRARAVLTLPAEFEP
jgi:hypothetical protein